MKFRVEFAESAFEDLAWFRKHERILILDAIEAKLQFQPMMETRNQKNLRENVLSRWELRVGNFRVFYYVNESTSIVDITAVGYKEHGKLFIRGREVQI
ncbi:MAG: type II toxin-antitoxin system RelE family toxin [bacterium]